MNRVLAQGKIRSVRASENASDGEEKAKEFEGEVKEKEEVSPLTRLG